MINSEHELIEYIYDTGPWDAVVVEGYDGVGKGRVLSILADHLRVTPYRPDYNLWQMYDHRKIDRWKISGFFWDVYSHFMEDKMRRVPPMLFDRGVISGAVYNNDESIARNYKTLLRDMKVLHILVTCSEEDYKKFARIRTTDDVDVDYAWSRYGEYTARYKRCLAISGVHFIEYKNVYNKSISSSLTETCEGCGHFSYGICRHPKKNCHVDPRDKRCEYSTDKEVQDVNVNEMHCV